MSECYSLGKHLDSAAAPPLAADILGRRGAALRIDAGGLHFIGTLSLQVLVAARRQWADDDHPFSIAPVSPALANAALGLGIDLAAIGADVRDISQPEPAE